MKNTTFVLPNKQFLECAGRSPKDSPASNEIQKTFKLLGSGAVCAEDAVRSNEWPASDGGPANVMASFYKPFMCAFRKGRQVLTPSLSDHFSMYGPGCEKNGLLCYFQPFADCESNNKSAFDNQPMSMGAIFDLVSGVQD
jgi:hypothetical protein